MQRKRRRKAPFFFAISEGLPGAGGGVAAVAWHARVIGNAREGGQVVIGPGGAG